MCTLIFFSPPAPNTPFIAHCTPQHDRLLKTEQPFQTAQMGTLKYGSGLNITVKPLCPPPPIQFKYSRTQVKHQFSAKVPLRKPDMKHNQSKKTRKKKKKKKTRSQKSSQDASSNCCDLAFRNIYCNSLPSIELAAGGKPNLSGVSYFKHAAGLQTHFC